MKIKWILIATILACSDVSAKPSLDAQLYAAAEKNNLKLMEKLMKAGAKPTASASGLSVMGVAIQKDNVEMMRFLASKGASLECVKDMTDFGGVEADGTDCLNSIHWAIWQDAPAVLEDILENAPASQAYLTQPLLFAKNRPTNPIGYSEAMTNYYYQQVNKTCAPNSASAGFCEDARDLFSRSSQVLKILRKYLVK